MSEPQLQSAFLCGNLSLQPVGNKVQQLQLRFVKHLQKDAGQWKKSEGGKPIT